MTQMDHRRAQRAADDATGTEHDFRAPVGHALSGLEARATSFYYEIEGLPPPEAVEGVVSPEVQTQIEELGKREPRDPRPVDRAARRRAPGRCPPRPPSSIRGRRSPTAAGNPNDQAVE